ncbi:MAG: hypothetical protein ACMUJM_14770 [bacterium]
MVHFRITPKWLMVLLIISIVVFLSASAGAQIFPSLINPLFPSAPIYPYPPAIRTSPIVSYPGIPGIPFAPPLPVFPEPVVRTANLTITLWNTAGKTSTLIIYNPTLLIGLTAAPVTPSPLLSLIAGQLLVFGNSALSTVNPAFYNYLVNTYLLPTGLAIYVFP